MNDPMIAAYEKAARIYCEKVGIEADRLVKVPHSGGLAVVVEIPQWHLVAEDLIDLGMKMIAIKEAATKPQIIMNGADKH